MRISKLLTKQHKLKLLENFADDVLMGYKTFEIRENDRGYQKGDTVKFFSVLGKMDFLYNIQLTRKLMK